MVEVLLALFSLLLGMCGGFSLGVWLSLRFLKKYLQIEIENENLKNAKNHKSEVIKL